MRHGPLGHCATRTDATSAQRAGQATDPVVNLLRRRMRVRESHVFLRRDVVAAVNSGVELTSCEDSYSRLGCVLSKFIGIYPVR